MIFLNGPRKYGMEGNFWVVWFVFTKERGAQRIKQLALCHTGRAHSHPLGYQKLSWKKIIVALLIATNYE